MKRNLTRRKRDEDHFKTKKRKQNSLQVKTKQLIESKESSSSEEDSEKESAYDKLLSVFNKEDDLMSSSEESLVEENVKEEDLLHVESDEEEDEILDDASNDNDVEAVRPPELNEEEYEKFEDKQITELATANNLFAIESSESCVVIPHYKDDMTDDIKDLLPKPVHNQTLEWSSLKSIRIFNRVKNSNNKLRRPKRALDAETFQKDYKIRKVLAENFQQFREGSKNLFDSEMLTLLSSYKDINFCYEDVMHNISEVRTSFCLHALNHVLRSRIVVSINNAKLAGMTPEEQEQSELRDQGLTRPKVLILVPFKSSALDIVNTMLKLLKRNKKLEVAHFKRFRKTFSPDPEEQIDPELMKKKPSDYQELFKGNTDEHFRFGVSVLSGAFRLFAPFYSSDVIVASPLGLRTVIGSKGEAHYEADFLSSIEMVILDQADVMLMQNWEHVLHIFQNMHLKPKEAHGVDFTRVRNSCLDGHSKFLRQTIAFSAFPNSQVSSLFTKQSFNYEGVVIVDQSRDKGTICEVERQLPQIFHKIEVDSLINSPDTRFKFFVERIYSQYKDPSMARTLVFIPQYFDYVRVRNYMRDQWKEGSGPVFSHMNDYSTVQDAAKARKRFMSGKSPILLYTERYHFYNRPYIKSIKHVVFYQLPTNPSFYAEMCNMVNTHMNASDAASSASVLVMHTRFDRDRVTNVLGRTRAQELITASKNVHLFVTGDQAK